MQNPPRAQRRARSGKARKPRPSSARRDLRGRQHTGGNWTEQHQVIVLHQRKLRAKRRYRAKWLLLLAAHGSPCKILLLAKPLNDEVWSSLAVELPLGELDFLTTLRLAFPWPLGGLRIYLPEVF